LPAGEEIAAAMGAALEAATDSTRRRAQGLHVTPPWLAEHLAGLALPADDPAAADASVCDPACGGGAFLLAAAERLAADGVARGEVVRERLWGADVDPVGLAAAEAALALWAGEAPPAGRLVVGDPLVAGAGLWPDAPVGGFGAVVGNPPFQSQLGRTTARSSGDQRRLRARYGAAVRAYTDTAWLFLLLGCELVRPRGRVVLVEPASLVAARDAEAVRAAVDGLAELHDLWVDPGRVFAASVRVCAPVLVRRVAPAPAPVTGDRWRGLWADVLGLPPAPAAVPAALGERARIVAGFRDEYYGLVGLVREHEPDDPPGAVAPLVTTGVLDWAGSSWGRREVRFAKRRWRAPVVDLRRLDAAGPPPARRWIERTRGPKLLVGSQTPVIEAAVDAAGAWVPSVPVLAVLPSTPDDLWRLAAAVLAPAATAWLARRAAGTGMERGVLRVAAPDLAALPLPVDDPAWEDAAAALRALAEDGAPGALDAYLVAAAAAYRAAPAAEAWWRNRLPAESTRLGATPAG
jgi:hypothetical protein